jgi:hypothetical protein
MNMNIKLWAAYQGRDPEEIETVDTWREARTLVREYRMAYGQGWAVWAGSKRGPR